MTIIIKLFGMIYATIGITTIIALRINADSDIQYTKKTFYNIETYDQYYKTFWHDLCHYWYNHDHSLEVKCP
jgi:hypothetical protein